MFENVKNLTETNIYEIGKIRVNIFCRLKFFPEFSKIGWGRGGQDNKTFLGLMTMQQSALFLSWITHVWWVKVRGVERCWV